MSILYQERYRNRHDEYSVSEMDKYSQCQITHDRICHSCFLSAARPLSLYPIISGARAGEHVTCAGFCCDKNPVSEIGIERAQHHEGCPFRLKTWRHLYRLSREIIRHLIPDSEKIRKCCVTGSDMKTAPRSRRRWHERFREDPDRTVTHYAAPLQNDNERHQDLNKKEASEFQTQKHQT